jgi:hypothetical protein
MFIKKHVFVSSAIVESRHNIPLLPSGKTNYSILFIHTLLHNLANDDPVNAPNWESSQVMF